MTIYIYTSSHLSIDQESSFPSSYFNNEALKELEPSMGHQIRKAAWRFNIVVWGWIPMAWFLLWFLLTKWWFYLILYGCSLMNLGFIIDAPEVSPSSWKYMETYGNTCVYNKYADTIPKRAARDSENWHDRWSWIHVDIDTIYASWYRETWAYILWVAPSQYQWQMKVYRDPLLKIWYSWWSLLLWGGHTQHIFA